MNSPERNAYGPSSIGEPQRQCVTTDLNEIEDLLGNLATHLGASHYKVHGPQPEEVGKDAPAQAGINRQLERIKSRLRVLTDHAYSLSESL